eukprot:scaffold32182_cov48-Attheya_sp.AAC.2
MNSRCPHPKVRRVCRGFHLGSIDFPAKFTSFLARKCARDRDRSKNMSDLQISVRERRSGHQDNEPQREQPANGHINYAVDSYSHYWSLSHRVTYPDSGCEAKIKWGVC